MAKYDVVAIRTIKAICAGAGTIGFLALILVAELLDKPIFIDVSRQSRGVSPCLKLG